MNFVNTFFKIRGLKEDDMKIIVEFIDKVIHNFENEEILKDVSREVHSFMNHRPLFMS